MAYERNTTEGIRSWLSAEINSPGWNSVSIAKGLTEDVMMIIVQDFNELDNRIKQGILLSTLCMRKGDLMALGDGLNKILQAAMNDSDDFVRTTAHVLQSYPNKQTLDLNIATWSDSFRSLVQSIGSTIKANGFNFHPPGDMILQPNARITPIYAANAYNSYKSTHTQHFTLSSNQKDIISSEARHARFKELVEMEERSEQAEAQAAQVVAQKRAGAELISSKAKRVASPTNNVSNPFPFPPHHRNNVPTNPGSMMSNAAATGRPVPPRSFSMGSVPNPPVSGSSSLFTKRPARPTRPSPSGPGGLFIKQNKPASGQRPMQRSATGGNLNNNLPRGLQRVQKTQMLDFSAASEIEQNTANAVKKAQDDIKAKAEAKKQEALDKKKKAADEKREREEAKKQQKAMAAAAAREAKEAAAAKKLAQEEQAAQESLPKSPTSAPNSPRTPTSPFSPKIKQEHVFAIPALPSHHAQQQQQQQQQQRLSPKTSPKTPPSEKLTTF